MPLGNVGGLGGDVHRQAYKEGMAIASTERSLLCTTLLGAT